MIDEWMEWMHINMQINSEPLCRINSCWCSPDFLSRPYNAWIGLITFFCYHTKAGPLHFGGSGKLWQKDMQHCNIQFPAAKHLDSDHRELHVDCIILQQPLPQIAHHLLCRNGDYVIPRLLVGVLRLDNRMPLSPYSSPVPGQTDIVCGNAIIHQIDFILLSPTASTPPPPPPVVG